MKKLHTIATILGLMITGSIAVQASPQQDLKEFRSYGAFQEGSAFHVNHWYIS